MGGKAREIWGKKKLKKAKTKTSWQDPRTGLSPWLRSWQGRATGTRAHVGRAVMEQDPHLNARTCVGATRGLAQSTE